MITTYVDKISTNMGELFLKEAQSLKRPHQNKLRLFTGEEIAYNCALTIGKIDFLSKIGEELVKKYPRIKVNVAPEDDGDGVLGYKLYVPFSILPPRKTLGIAKVDKYATDLNIYTNSPRLTEIIEALAPQFESEVQSLDKHSTLSSLKVKIKPATCYYIAQNERIEKYFKELGYQ